MHLENLMLVDLEVIESDGFSGSDSLGTCIRWKGDKKRPF